VPESKIASSVLKTWVEDFVDEDTGEVVSIERNDVIIDRESVLDIVTLTSSARLKISRISLSLSKPIALKRVVTGNFFSARIIPFKGSWIEFATDINNVMYAYIDRKKKLPVTARLKISRISLSLSKPIALKRVVTGNFFLRSM